MLIVTSICGALYVAKLCHVDLASFICTNNPVRWELIREQRLREVKWSVQGHKAKKKLQSQDLNLGHLTENSYSLPHHILCVSSLEREKALSNFSSKPLCSEERGRVLQTQVFNMHLAVPASDGEYTRALARPCSAWPMRRDVWYSLPVAQPGQCQLPCVTTHPTITPGLAQHRLAPAASLRRVTRRHWAREAGAGGLSVAQSGQAGRGLWAMEAHTPPPSMGSGSQDQLAD